MAECHQLSYAPPTDSSSVKRLYESCSHKTLPTRAGFPRGITHHFPRGHQVCLGCGATYWCTL